MLKVFIEIFEMSILGLWLRLLSALGLGSWLEIGLPLEPAYNPEIPIKCIMEENDSWVVPM
jgi:hypothetical protein